MSEAAFPSTFLAVVIWMHIAIGGAAAFVLCPLAAFASKGSELHRKAGRLYLIAVVLICCSGMLALSDPRFLGEYWQQESAAKGFGEIFRSSRNPTAFFLFLVVMLFYMSFSAARLWSRIEHGAARRISSNAFDWALAATLFVYALGFLVVGIEDLLSHSQYASTFLVGGLLMLAFAGFDFYTFLARPRVEQYPWWALHMTKLMYAWAGLIDAFWIRLKVYVLPPALLEEPMPLGTVIWLGFTAIAYFRYRRSMR